MRIKLKKILLENFKGAKENGIIFGEKTSIKGANATGKTTIFDAFTWLLFGKNSAGDEKFNVRPLDKDGNRVDNVEIKVSAVLDVDGKEVELSKVQKQNWVKKRGTDTVALQGNVNLFEVDGYPKLESDFKEFVSGMVHDEDLFKILTNPQYFPSMKWKDQRDILMQLAPDFSDVELAQQNSKYCPLIPELEKAPSTDDIRAKFSKALTEWKKKQVEIPVRIDEAAKSRVDVDVAEQELAKVELERQIAEIDGQIANAGNATAELEREEMQLQFDMSGIMQTMGMELKEKRRAIEREAESVAKRFNDLHQEIQIAENAVALNEKAIEEKDEERKKLGVLYSEERVKAFDETPYQFDESKWVFDESTTVCSLCGQKLPEDKIESLKAEFEQKKADAKERAERQLNDAITRFNADKKMKLDALVANGNKCKDFIEKTRENNSDLKVSIGSLKVQEVEALAKKNDLERQLSELPQEADYSQNPEYVSLKSRHDEVIAEIAKLESAGEEMLVEELKSKKADLQDQLAGANRLIAQAAMNVEIDERIAQLQTEQKEIGQKVADQEQMLYLLESFIRFKLDKISDSINSHFKTVNFKLFEMQLNGGMKDCCECTVNGVPYSSLNTGHRIVAGLDIICSLSELCGVSVPIFIDNCEAVSSGNLPDMDSQMICLYVSDDKDLKVEGV